MPEVKCFDGTIVLVDNEDEELVSKYSWSCMRCGVSLTLNTYLYATAREGNKKILMHVLIMNPPNGMQVDHVDYNGLNNKRSNLRICTQSQNMRHNRRLAGISGFRGVDPINGRWRARIKVDNKVFHLGMFDNVEDAAEAYDIAATRYGGEFARTNF